MKRTLGLTTLMLAPLLLASCDIGVTPFGYVTYKCVGEEASYYSSVAFGTDHIYVFENADLVPNGEDYEQPIDFRLACSSNSFLTVQFKQIHGAEDINDERYQLVNLEKWYYIQVNVKKGTSKYDDNKHVYLNGEMLTEKNEDDHIYDSDVLRIFYYHNCGIKRSNSGGTIHQDVLNYIEYK